MARRPVLMEPIPSLRPLDPEAQETGVALGDRSLVDPGPVDRKERLDSDRSDIDLGADLRGQADAIAVVVLSRRHAGGPLHVVRILDDPSVAVEAVSPS